jgi:peptidylprolyl isomerase
MKARTVILIMVVLLLIVVIGAMITGRATMGNKNTKVLVETTEGNFVIELYSDMPVTAGNFEKLVRDGYYDGIIFHRVIANFMIQGGDPTGTGGGGPGYTIKDEFVAGHSNLRGTISMANAGPNTGGSQFFINLVDNTFLDYDKQPFTSKHPVFGRVVEGMDVIDKIGKVQTGAGDRPIKEVKIIRASVV